jgi:Na+/H+-dicarboxylate symporter
MPESPRRKHPPAWWLTGGSVCGLALGILVGVWARTTGSAAGADLLAFVSPIGALWVDALRMTVLPLVVSQLIVAVASARGRAVGRLGVLSLAVFLALLGAGGAFTLAAAPPLISGVAPAPGALAGLHADGPSDPVRKAPEGVAQWLDGIVPTNVLKSAADDDLLPVIVFSVLFGLALTRVHPEGRRVVIAAFRAIAEAMLVLVGWIMLAAPAGVFVLAFRMAASTGFQTAHVLASFVIVVCTLLLVFTALLYPIAVLVGRIPLHRFVRGLIPSQLVAVSTRSSIAALPSLLEGAERLRMRAMVSGFVLPLAASTFKVNRTISSPAKLLFLAYLYNIDLSAAQIGSFLVAVLIMSFSTVGVPNGGSAFKTLPFYVAAGIPVEGAVILEAVEDIPDIVKTVTNVTGNMTAAALVGRFAPAPESIAVEEPVAVGAPAAAL